MSHERTATADENEAQGLEMTSNVSYDSANYLLTSSTTSNNQTEPIYEEINEETTQNISLQETGTQVTARFSLSSKGTVALVISIAILLIITVVIILNLLLKPMSLPTAMVNKSLDNNTDNNVITSTAPIKFITSCSMLAKSSPSDYYWILSSNGSTIRVYCDMKKTCGSITGGWMRVTSLDMKQPSSKCPSSLCLNTTTPHTCRRCYDYAEKVPWATYDVGVTYSRVCGRIIAYQVGTPNGYRSAYQNGFDGIALTHGSPEYNIWSFVAALEENYTCAKYVCPCINPNDHNIAMPPPFIGNSYFCDTATSKAKNEVFYSENLLWDGQGCMNNNKCCSFNSPPWFYRKLPEPTTDPIVLKIKFNKGPRNEDIAIKVIDIFVI